MTDGVDAMASTRALPDKHMGVAEVKRRFADVVGEVMHTGRRIVVERRGRPVVAIVPIEESAEATTPGQRLAEAFGCGGDDGVAFHEFMLRVVEERHRRMPRPLPEDEE
jgi:prevent-host-death family protein